MNRGILLNLSLLKKKKKCIPSAIYLVFYQAHNPRKFELI